MGRNVIRKFLRAAELRYEAAEILQSAGYNSDAIHLAGIAAECAVKALILSYVPLARRAQFKETHFRGARGHRFDYLRNIMVRQGCSFPQALQSHWRRFTTWSIDIRYETIKIPTRDALRFLESSAAAIKLTKGRLL